jgi:hypothetical protein
MVCGTLVSQQSNYLPRLLAREYFAEGKLPQVPINPPQILYGPAQERIKASVMIGRQQTS